MLLGAFESASLSKSGWYQAFMDVIKKKLKHKKNSSKKAEKLKFFKDRNDSKMPTERNELIERYKTQKHRMRKPLSKDEHVLELFRKWQQDENSKKKGKRK